MKIRDFDELPIATDGKVLVGASGTICTTDSDLSDIIGDLIVPATSGKVDKSTYAEDKAATEQDIADIGTELDTKLDTTAFNAAVSAIDEDLESLGGNLSELDDKIDAVSGIVASDYALSADVSTALAGKEDKVFVAEYGVTPYADIKDAYDTGKQIVCKYQINLAQLAYAQLSQFIDVNNTFVFINTLSTQTIQIVCKKQEEQTVWVEPVFSHFYDTTATSGSQQLTDAFNTKQDTLSFGGTNNVITAINTSAVGQTLAAGTDLKIEDGKVKVNTTGKVTGNYAFVEGYETSAIGVGSHAEGDSTSAFNDYSHTENCQTTAGYGAHAEGLKTYAANYYTHAEGYYTSAFNQAAHTEGRLTVASGGHGIHAEGDSCSAILSNNSMAHVEGYKTLAEGDSNAAHAEGYQTYVSGEASHAEGYNTKAIGKYLHVEGSGTSAFNEAAHAEGYNTIASGKYSHAEGYNTSAMKQTSHAEGISTSAGDNSSHAEGYKTSAGYAAHSEGNTTIASASNSHAEGNKTSAFAQNSHAEGQSTIVSGDTSHAEGYYTSAFGKYSHTEGYQTFISGTTSDDIGLHAEGYNSSAFKRASHTEGESCIASAVRSHAEGYGSSAMKQVSHSEGMCTLANGSYSHAEGYYTVAGSDYMHVGGKFNKTSADALFVIGNGTTDLVRNDAFTVNGSGLASATKLATSGISDIEHEFGNKLNTSAIQFVSTSGEAVTGTQGVIYIVTGTNS